MRDHEAETLRPGTKLVAKTAGLGERWWRAEVVEPGARRVTVRFLAGPRTGQTICLPLSKLKSAEERNAERSDRGHVDTVEGDGMEESRVGMGLDSGMGSPHPPFAARSRGPGRARKTGLPPVSVLAAAPAPERVEALVRSGVAVRASGLAVPKPRTPRRSEAHLARVRAMPCCVCSAPAPSDPHHFGPRGMGQKTSDFRVVPLCRVHHDEWHAKHACAPYDRAETTELFLRKQVDVLVEILEET